MTELESKVKEELETKKKDTPYIVSIYCNGSDGKVGPALLKEASFLHEIANKLHCEPHSFEEINKRPGVYVTDFMNCGFSIQEIVLKFFDHFDKEIKEIKKLIKEKK